MRKKIIELLSSKRKIILVHGNADMDAIGSAYAVSRAFPPGDVYAPAGVDRVARVAAERLGLNVLEECDLSDYELVVAVDTSSPEQFKPAVEALPDDCVVIDHHLPSGRWNNELYLCDSTKVSCCEIIKELIDEAGIPLTKDVSMALLGGMLTDSGHFQFSNPAMMRSFADVQENAGIGMDEAMDFTKTQTSMSERIAMMKAVGKSKFDRVGDMIVAVSQGSSFESSSCRALMSSGADVAFVASQRDKEYRLSARASQEMVRRGIHLGNILGIVSNETDADGGGHGGAAGMSGTGDAEAMLHMCMSRTMDEFRKIRSAMETESSEREN